MKKLFVAVSRCLFIALYKAFDVLPRREEVLFFSRQSNSPSRDFLELGRQFENRGFTSVYLTKKLSKKTALPYMGHIVRELYHLARCRVCFLDRYDPVVCMLDFKCEPVDSSVGIGKETFKEFPCEPVIIQLWHAFGAFKKFGYQSVDTVEGHPAAIAEQFRIHRNYSYVVCSGERCIQPFSEAFNCPKSRVVPLLRPEYDWLLKKKQTSAALAREEKPMILFAPTLRKSSTSEHPLRSLYESGLWKNLLSCAQVVWSFHPLEETGLAPVDANEALFRADYVVTDYSSIVYEAFVLGKGVLFYTPDIETYRRSPGLNVDPEAECPALVFKCSDAIVSALLDFCSDKVEYPEWQLSHFMRGSFADEDTSATDSIVDFALEKIGRGSCE